MIYYVYTYVASTVFVIFNFVDGPAMANMSLDKAKLVNVNIRKFREEIGAFLLANSVGSYW